MALSRALSSLLCLKRHDLPGEGMPEHALPLKELVGHDLSDLDSDSAFSAHSWLSWLSTEGTHLALCLGLILCPEAGRFWELYVTPCCSVGPPLCPFLPHLSFVPSKYGPHSAAQSTELDTEVGTELGTAVLDAEQGRCPCTWALNLSVYITAGNMQDADTDYTWLVLAQS